MLGGEKTFMRFAWYKEENDLLPHFLYGILNR